MKYIFHNQLVFNVIGYGKTSDRQKECGEVVFLCLNAFLLNEGRDEKFHTGFPTNLSHFLFSSLP